MNELQKRLIVGVIENIEEYWPDMTIQKMFLTERETCVPDEVCVDDLHQEIFSMFYAVFGSLARAVEEEIGHDLLVYTAIEVCYDDASTIIQYGRFPAQPEFLCLVERREAWNFWWPTLPEMGRQMEEWYNEVLARAQAHNPVHSQEIEVALGILQEELAELERNQPYLPPEEARRLLAARKLAIRALQGHLPVEEAPPQEVHVLVEGYQGVVEGVRAFVDEEKALVAFRTYTGRDYEEATAEAEEKGVSLWDVIGWEYDPTNIYVVPLK